jgi:hypothetical protein
MLRLAEANNMMIGRGWLRWFSFLAGNPNDSDGTQQDASVKYTDAQEARQIYAMARNVLRISLFV